MARYNLPLTSNGTSSYIQLCLNLQGKECLSCVLAQFANAHLR